MGGQRLRTPTPLEEVRRLIAAHVDPVQAIDIETKNALGAILAEDVVAGPAPRSTQAARDGFAVASEETTGAGAYAPAPLATHPVRVSTGDDIPQGYDAVTALDAIDASAPLPFAIEAVAPGEGVAAIGSKVLGGRRFSAGTAIDARLIAALLAANVERVRVRRPTVGFLGGEHMLSPMPSTIHAVMPSAIHGMPSMVFGLPSMDFALLSMAAPTTRPPELAIRFGGTGEGAGDDAALDLARRGRLIVHGVAIEPGGTTALGLVDGRPVLALPRHPPAALAALILIGRPLLDRLAGRARAPTTWPMPTTRKIAARAGLTRLVFVRRAGAAVEPLGSGDIPLDVLATADGFVIVPPTSEGYAAGAVVEVEGWG